MARKKAKVVDDPEAPVETEVLSDAIVKISRGMRSLLASGINKRAIVVLLHDAAPSRGNRGKPSKRAIEDVIDCLGDLENRYITPRLQTTRRNR